MDETMPHSIPIYGRDHGRPNTMLGDLKVWGGANGKSLVWADREREKYGSAPKWYSF